MTFFFRNEKMRQKMKEENEKMIIVHALKKPSLTKYDLYMLQLAATDALSNKVHSENEFNHCNYKYSIHAFVVTGESSCYYLCCLLSEGIPIV